MDKFKEGDLYKVIVIENHEFVIKYGYYEQQDRLSKFNEPIPIFPDFIKNPKYNKNGNPFVTYMQDKCIYYKGNKEQESCYGCKFFKAKEDLIGICNCPMKKEDK